MKTKIFLLTGLVILSFGSVYPQGNETGKNTLRLEAGYAFTGSGDLEGYCFYNEYSRSISSRFRVGPAIGFMNFFRDDQDGLISGLEVLHSANCLSFDLTGYFYPLMTPKLDLEGGLGLYVRKWHWIYATGPDQVASVRGTTVGPGSYFDDYVTAPGYTVSIGTVLKLSYRMGFSIRGVYQNDTNGDNSATVRFGLKIQL
jgi:hypothetical protein